MGPSGLIGIQRKVHASHDEFFRFRQAYEWHVFDLGFCKAGVLICHDSSFFESWRVLALLGAEVILAPHSIRKMISEAGEMVFDGGEMQADDAQRLAAQAVLLDTSPNLANHRVMARGNGVAMIYSGQVGFDGHSDHAGGGYMLDPTGRMIARTEPGSATSWIHATLDADLSEQIRRHPWFPLKQRRPETYGELTRQL